MGWTSNEERGLAEVRTRFRAWQNRALFELGGALARDFQHVSDLATILDEKTRHARCEVSAPIKALKVLSDDGHKGLFEIHAQLLRDSDAVEATLEQYANVAQQDYSDSSDLHDCLFHSLTQTAIRLRKNAPEWRRKLPWKSYLLESKDARQTEMRTGACEVENIAYGLPRVVWDLSRDDRLRELLTAVPDIQPANGTRFMQPFSHAVGALSSLVASLSQRSPLKPPLGR